MQRRRNAKTLLFVVDDDPLVLRALRRLFEPEGYQVDAFESVSQARAAMDRRRPALVISDNCMPETKGAVFLHDLRRIHPQLCTLLLTGGPLASAASGIDAVVQKPWDPADLKERVRLLLLRSDAGDEPPAG